MDRTLTATSLLWFVKSKRAQTDTDDETWIEGGVCPTMNAFDSGDSRATVLAVFQQSSMAGKGTMGVNLEARVAKPVKTQGDGQMVAVSFTASEQANSYAWERPIYPTITAQVPNDTSNLQQGVRMGSMVRRLTPEECELLQAFPMGWTAGQADSHRYKQMGNAVTVNVAHYVATLFADALQHGRQA